MTDLETKYNDYVAKYKTTPNPTQFMTFAKCKYSEASKFIKHKTQQSQSSDESISKQSNQNDWWSCHSCTFLNSKFIKQCEICQTPKHSNNSQINHSWNCSFCSYANPKTTDLCEMCGNTKHSHNSLNITHSDFKETKNDSVQDLVENVIHKTWNCNSCSFINDSCVTHCQMCGTAQFINKSPPKQTDDFKREENKISTPDGTETDKIKELMNSGFSFEDAKIALELSRQHNDYTDKMNESNKTWSCVICTFGNSESLNHCEMCGTLRNANNDLKQNDYDAKQDDYAAPQSQWNCPACTFSNDEVEITCRMCNAPKFMEMKSSDFWECKNCTFHNDLKLILCEMCFCKKNGEQKHDEQKRDEQLIDLILKMKEIQYHDSVSDKNKKHEMIICPRLIAQKLRRSTLLRDIHNGLALLQCAGVIDILNELLETKGFVNCRKQSDENWTEYINNLSVDSFLSFLDMIALAITTGYNLAVYCEWNDSPNNLAIDILKILQIYDNNITHSQINCLLCQQQNHSHSIVNIQWSNDLKLKLLHNICACCIKAGCMKPKYNIKPGKDLDKNALLNALEKTNQNHKFLNIKKLNCDLTTYEECKKQSCQSIPCEQTPKGKIVNYSKSDIQKWSKMYKSLPKTQKMKYYHELIAILSRAVRLWTKKYYPRYTQLIPIFLAIEYEQQYYNPETNKGILYEIGTGEGKSVVVVLMCAIQYLLFDELSDVATSQKLLAEREADATTGFFSMLNIGDGAKYINQDENETKQNRKQCYKSPVIYSTAYNYECDLLHGANGKEIDCRDGRVFAVNIVDEVDNSFIDLALNSTRLSSPTPGYKEINTILLIICSNMKLSVGALGDVYVIEDTAYFAPNTNKMHIISKYEMLIESCSKSTKNICFIIADRISNYYTENKRNAVQLLQEYGLYFVGLNYNKLVKAINYMKYKEPKLFLQFISNQAVLDLNTLIMQQRINGKTNKIDVDYCCCFENGDIVNRTVSCKDFKGYIALSVDNSSVIDWNNLICLEKLDEKSFEKQIKENVRKNVIAYMNDKTSILPSFVTDVIYNRLDVWIDSCWRALFFHHVGKDYVIEKNRICPVDYDNTGCVQHNMHWSNGLHEFLQLKHNLKLSTIGTAANMMTNSCYFGLFKKTYGLTGTLGGEQEINYYKNCFNVDIVRIPSFRIKSNIKYENIACNNYKEWIQLILLSTYSNLRKGRAVLIISKFKINADTIEQQLKINNYSNNRVMRSCYKYTRDDRESEKASVSTTLYGGDVVVATNLAGRGTDIQLNDNVNSNGGLHVIITFMPPNIRIEKQALGRTARAGNPGSCVIIINKQNCDYARQIQNDSAIESVRNFYSQHRMYDLEERVQSQKRIESFYQRFMKQITELSTKYGLNDEDKNQIFYLWALTYSTMQSDMNNDQLQSIYSGFMDKITNDLNKDTESNNSLQIAYNPHYLTWNGIKHSNSYGGSLIDKSISMLGIQFNGIAYYFKARNIIIRDCKAQNEAISYLYKANESFQYYLQRAKQMNMMHTTRECLKNKQLNEPINVNKRGTIGGQIEFEIKYWSTLIEITEQNVKQLQDTGKKAKVNCESIMDAISDIDDYEEYKRGVIHYYISCGMCNILKFEAKRSWWDRIKGFIIAAIGVLEIIAGTFISAIPGLQTIGKSLISNGIDAVIEGVMAMITGQCDDFGDWLERHALKVGISALCAGVGALVEKLMSTLSKFIPQKLIDIGKKIFDGAKKLHDKGVFKKIKDGNFELFDMNSILEVSTSFVGHDGIRQGINATRNTINFAEAIKNGEDPINSIMEFGQNTLNMIGDDDGKEAANNALKNVRTGINIGRNIANGDVDGVMNNTFELGNGLIDDNDIHKGISIARKGYHGARHIANGDGWNGANEIMGIGDDIFDNERSQNMKNAMKYSRQGLRTVQRFSEAENADDVLDALVDESGGWLNEFGNNDINQFHGRYIHNGWNGIKNIKNGNIAAGFDNFNAISGNVMQNIKNNSNLKGFMRNASCMMETKQSFEECDQLLARTKSYINQEVQMYFGNHSNMQKEFEIMGMLLNGNQYINDAEHKEFVQRNHFTNDSEMIQWIVAEEANKSYDANRNLNRCNNSLRSMFSNLNNINGIQRSFQSSNFKQNIHTQVEEIVKVYKKKMDELSSYSKQKAKWKSDGVDISINALNQRLRNQNNLSIPNHFMDGITNDIAGIVSNNTVSNVEPNITATLQPNKQTMQSMHSNNMLNQIMNQNKPHGKDPIVNLLEQNYQNMMQRQSNTMPNINANKTTYTKDNFYHALHLQESGGKLDAPTGDNGKALGPYQIWKVYFDDSRINGKYEDVVETMAGAKSVVDGYMKRYAKNEWSNCMTIDDVKKCARIHNGGPRGHKKSATQKYWTQYKSHLSHLKGCSNNSKCSY
eukprot:302944_1